MLADKILERGTNAVFDDALVTGGSFSGGASGLVSSQLYSTASYQNRQLQRIQLRDDLAGWNFAHQDLTEARFSNSNLAGTTFTSANLTGAVFSTLLFGNADFTDAQLTNAVFDVPELSNVNFTRADLTGASLNNVDLSTANFTDAHVKYAILDRIPRQSLYATASYLQGELPGVRIEYYEPEPLDLSSQNLRGAGLTGYLGLIELTGSDVRGVEFITSLQPNDPLALTNVQLYSTASYQAKDMEGVVFRMNHLPTIDLQGQNLALSTFTASDLGGSDFSAADLRGANFHAEPSGTELPDENLINTIFPDGSIYGLHLLENKNLFVRDHDGGIVAAVGRIGPREVPPTAIVIRDEFVMDETGTLTLRFDDDEWNSTISFDAAIPVQLGGSLELTFAPDVDVATLIGRTFDLFDWAGVSPTGAFTVSSLFSWNLTSLYTTGEVTLLGPSGSLPGDHNGDGVVNAADFVAWRDQGELQSGYSTWRDNFGLSLGDGSIAVRSVPEPSTVVLIVAGAIELLLLCSRSRGPS